MYFDFSWKIRRCGHTQTIVLHPRPTSSNSVPDPAGLHSLICYCVHRTSCGQSLLVTLKAHGAVVLYLLHATKEIQNPDSSLTINLLHYMQVLSFRKMGLRTIRIGIICMSLLSIFPTSSFQYCVYSGSC